MINNSIVDRQGPSPWYALVNRCSCLDHSEWEKLYLTRVICGSLSLEFVAVQCFSGIVLISPALSVFFLCLTCVAGCTVCIWAPLFPCLIQLLFHHITFHFPHFFSSPHGDSRVPSQLILPHSDWCCLIYSASLFACACALIKSFLSAVCNFLVEFMERHRTRLRRWSTPPRPPPGCAAP